METTVSYTTKRNVPVTREVLMPLAEELVELLLRKNHDYGNSWEGHGLAGVLVRLSDKCLRLENLQNVEALVVGEGAEDNLMDIAGYSFLGLLWLRHKRSQEQGQESFADAVRSSGMSDADKAYWLGEGA